MKQLIAILLLSAISKASCSQQAAPSTGLTAQVYLKKSRHQKTAAWIMTGMGILAAATGVGLIVVENDIGNGASPGSIILTCSGGVVLAGSFFLFDASSRNKRRAASLSFKNQCIPQLNNRGFVSKTVPSLCLRISI